MSSPDTGRVRPAPEWAGWAAGPEILQRQTRAAGGETGLSSFFYGPVGEGGGGCPIRLTRNQEDEDGSGHARVAVEHESEVVPQLHRVVHVGHKHGGDQETDGTAQLQTDQRTVRARTAVGHHLTAPRI